MANDNSAVREIAERINRIGDILGVNISYHIAPKVLKDLKKNQPDGKWGDLDIKLAVHRVLSKKLGITH